MLVYRMSNALLDIYMIFTRAKDISYALKGK